MAVTGEYATGTIRATLAAVPKRLPVLWAKCGVFVAVTLVLGTIACVLAFVGGQAIFAGKDVDASFSDPHVARAVFGSGLFLTGMGAFGLALGALVRNTAAAITTLTLVLFVVPGDRRPAPVGGHDRPVPAGHRGAVDHVRRAWRARAVGGLRRAVRLRCGHDGSGRRHAEPTRRVNRLHRHPLLADLLLTLVLLGICVASAPARRGAAVLGRADRSARLAAAGAVRESSA